MSKVKKLFKFQLFSDLHLELCKYIPYIKPLTDYLFLAGDIGNISKPNLKLFIDYCSKNWKKTFYVLGNHEFYHNNKTYDKLIKAYDELISSYDNVYILNDSFYDLEIDNTTQYRIYGSVLWSNINSIETINDFKMIKMKNEKNWTVPVDLKYFNQLHSNSLKKLLDEVKKSNLENRKLIVITHFPPVRNNTSHPKYDTQPDYIRNYFSNDLELYNNIECWMSGHTHYSYDFIIKETRFISNQFGYPDELDTLINYIGLFEI